VHVQARHLFFGNCAKQQEPRFIRADEVAFMAKAESKKGSSTLIAAHFTPVSMPNTEKVMPDGDK